jgi:ferric-dicitrate binding protein FerR (iron transport regulator)
MQSKRLRYLFEGYLSGRLNPSENKEWLDYIANDKNNTTIRGLIDETLEAAMPGYEQPAEKAEKIFNTIIAHKSPGTVSGIVRMNILKWTAVAASVILLAGLSLFYLIKQNNKSGSDKQPAHDLMMVKAPVQNRRYILLADGSRVILHQGSTLTHPPVFTGNTRDVYLSGEGYFDIKHDDKKPFVVHTGNIKTTVLGTAFNISAYRDQSSVIVTVTRGKVRVEDSHHSIGIITPNEQIRVDALSGQAKKLAVDATAVTEWKRKDLVFDDIPLGEAALALEMQFNVSIVFDESALKTSHITASFINNEPLEQILKVITRINKMQYNIKDGHVTITAGDAK